MTQYLKIREFSDLVGLSPTTVRKYEEEGILLPHHKSIKGQRLYTMEQVNAYIIGDFENPVLTGRPRE